MIENVKRSVNLRWLACWCCLFHGVVFARSDSAGNGAAKHGNCSCNLRKIRFTYRTAVYFVVLQVRCAAFSVGSNFAAKRYLVFPTRYRTRRKCKALFLRRLQLLSKFCPIPTDIRNGKFLYRYTKRNLRQSRTAPILPRLDRSERRIDKLFCIRAYHSRTLRGSVNSSLIIASASSTSNISPPYVARAKRYQPLFPSTVTPPLTF